MRESTVHKLQFLCLVALGVFLMPLASDSGMAHVCHVASALPLVPVADFIDHDAFPPGAFSLGMLPNKMLPPSLWLPNPVATQWNHLGILTNC